MSRSKRTFRPPSKLEETPPLPASLTSSSTSSRTPAPSRTDQAPDDPAIESLKPRRRHSGTNRGIMVPTLFQDDQDGKTSRTRNRRGSGAHRTEPKAFPDDPPPESGRRSRRRGNSVGREELRSNSVGREERPRETMMFSDEPPKESSRRSRRRGSGAAGSKWQASVFIASDSPDHKQESTALPSPPTQKASHPKPPSRTLSDHVGSSRKDRKSKSRSRSHSPESLAPIGVSKSSRRTKSRSRSRTRSRPNSKSRSHSPDSELLDDRKSSPKLKSSSSRRKKPSVYVPNDDGSEEQGRRTPSKSPAGTFRSNSFRRSGSSRFVPRDPEPLQPSDQIQSVLDSIAPPTLQESRPSSLRSSLRGSSDDSKMRKSASRSRLMKEDSRRRRKDKKKGKIGWTENVFVVSGSLRSMDEEATENTTESSSSKPKKRKSRRKSEHSTRIDDKAKRDVRFQWNKLLISKTIQPYRTMIGENDDLLPDTDDGFEALLEGGDDEIEQELDEIRDAMLDDQHLSEREVAAFFEGFNLFNVKIRSLQSQLESAKAINRSQSQSNITMRSMSSFRGLDMMSLEDKRRVLLTSFKSGGESSSTKDQPTVVRSMGGMPAIAPRVAAQKSLRELSIKKIKTEHEDEPEVQKLLRELEEYERKQKKLEKQLQTAGIVIAEDIPYEEAKSQVEQIAKRMNEIGSVDGEEYFKLEKDFEKYNTALMLTDEWIEEQEEMERKWEEDNAADNLESLKKLRRHMPVNVKSLSEAQLSSDLTPNNKVLPKAIAKKFKRTNVLQLLRVDPDDIVRMHPSTLENLRVTGMTLTERRAMYSHIASIGPRWKSMQADPMTERKWTWFKMMKQNFRENLDSYQRHVAKYGPPGNHPYATRSNPSEGCPLIGKQCPLKADKLIDYDNDYGYTDEAEYEVSNVRKADAEDPGAKAMREAAELAREKKSSERSDALKKHYKGKVLQVSLANGSCESMDEAMDRIEFVEKKWIEDRLAEPEITDDRKRKELGAFSEALNDLKLQILQFAERSGMQLTGKKDANADQPDIRSAIELGLSEELYEATTDFFKGITERMEEMKATDGRLKSSIEQLGELLDELHERNLATLKELGVDCPEPSRKRMTREEITADIKAKMAPEEEEIPEEVVEEDPAHGGLMSAIRGAGGGGRGNLMAAIAGRGRGGGDDGGRGGLMAAIAGRGRGRGGGRGDLMSAIAARGRGRGGARDAGGGRGDLMAAIASRGRGGRGNARDAGGRGDLMAAIASRGRGGRGNVRDAGGRGDLMAAIAARGRGRGNAREAGGRGDLMAAIAARGRGRGADGKGPPGGRGDLMAAIAARGRGADGKGPPGGRGDLMAAIAARGRGAEDASKASSPAAPEPAPRPKPKPPNPMGGGNADLLAAIKARRKDDD